MNKNQSRKIWRYKPQAPKFTASDKEKIISKAKTMIRTMPKLSQKVSRVDMRGNRIYLYELVEQLNPDGAKFIKPLIDGKYLEFPYARITLLDKQGNSSTADWQRHNNQWVTIYTGTYIECLTSIEKDENWF